LRWVLNEIIGRYIEEYKFSDIHLKENQPVMLRVNGEMIIPEEDVISSAQLREFAHESLTEDQLTHFSEVRDVDLAIELEIIVFVSIFSILRMASLQY
jgi:Tfp pilus assembly protein, pilus retraction ATPase PilT